MGYTLIFNDGKNQVVILVDHSFLNLKLKNFEPQDCDQRRGGHDEHAGSPVEDGAEVAEGGEGVAVG